MTAARPAGLIPALVGFDMRDRALTQEMLEALPVAAAVFTPGDLRLKWASPSFPLAGPGLRRRPRLAELVPELSDSDVQAVLAGSRTDLSRPRRSGGTVLARRLGSQRARGLLVLLSAGAEAEAVLAASPAAHLVVDAAATVVAANPAAATSLGLQPGALTGRPLASVQQRLVPYGSNEADTFPAVRTMRSGAPVSEEAWQANLPDGAPRTVLVSAVPLPGTPGGALTVWMDATEQARRLARAREEIADREMRVREANHRVKNTLQIVTSLLSMEIARTVDLSAARALRQAYSRLMAAGRVHQRLYLGAELDRIDLSDYLTEVANDVRQTLVPERPAECLVTRVDPVRVEPDLALNVALIAVELLTNAFKHGVSPARPFRVEMTCRATSERLLLEVRDAGPGLPAGFDPVRTTGLGMQLLNSLCEHLGGTFVAFSPAVGAVFRVELPLT
ncbi:sensor histidine kinase [Arenibaculum pallidiluteum]|uniref:sensor histidine kinase n=1 Tax=Arenibaculum pallidiluteum TaxID=2812559 RepID=UPI001A978AAA|nr:sensor histidine kinase [Arenibaculum pallidiluteum]